MRASSVLVVTDAQDPTAGRVCAELAVRGVPVCQIDAADFPTGLRLAAMIGPGQAAWSGSLTGATLDGRQIRVDLADIRSAYYRRPTEFRLAEEMSGPERRFAYDEARRGFGGVLQGLDILWINDPVRTAAAEYKPVQLATAAACGLKVPATIVTNDPRHAAAWVADLRRPVIYKTLGGAWHAEEGVVKVIYTSPVADPAALADPSLMLTAHMFQEQTVKQYEARAVVVGERIFTVAIHTDTLAGRLDWRTDYGSHRYEVIDLPGGVRDGLLELHTRLGLVYGACDLALDDRGDWVLYETNAAGEWGWLADECGLPIAEALADLLTKGAA